MLHNAARQSHIDRTIAERQPIQIAVHQEEIAGSLSRLKGHRVDTHSKLNRRAELCEDLRGSPQPRRKEPVLPQTALNFRLECSVRVLLISPKCFRESFCQRQVSGSK